MFRLRILLLFLLCSFVPGIAHESAASPPHASESAQQTVTVPASEMLGLVDEKVMPQYPKAALVKGTEGDVIFNIVVDKNGSIVSHKLVSGDPLLVKASEEALRQYRFRPYTVDGNPVEVNSQMGFRFTTERKGAAAQGHVECMETIQSPVAGSQ